MTERRDGNRPGERAGDHAARSIAEVVGDLLPETTSDERASGERPESAPEDWYRQNRPPHHGS